MLEELVAVRRQLHAHPELSHMEFNTANLIEQTLRDWGITDLHRPLPTCVCAHLGTGRGPVIALRADIDALAQEEQNELPYRSTVPGVMHACGHDLHTAILLGAARVLEKAELPGTVICLFQPAEERGPNSGGRRLVNEVGWVEDHHPDEIYGFHVWPWLPIGVVGCKAGAIMGGPSRLKIRVTGKGGHAAMPHTTVDAIAIAGQIISGLQTIVSREVDPGDQVVISICSIQGGTCHNAIAETVEMEGTTRTLSEESRAKIHRRIQSLCTGVAEGMGGSVEVTITPGAFPTINDAACAHHMKEAVEAALGTQAYVPIEKTPMTGEDFSVFLQRIPGAFAFLGCSSPGQTVFPLHSPRFSPDESVIANGIRVYTELVHNFFRRRM